MEKSTSKILCVDDEENILNTFHRTLGRQYDLYTATSAAAALALLEQHGDIAVIVSDYNMPEMNGAEFLQLAGALSPESVQVMLTGNADLNIAIQTINQTHIYRYLPKPYPTEELRKVIADCLEQYQLIVDKRRLALELEQKNAELAASYETLAQKKYLLEHELEMAKIVYSKIYAYCHTEPDGLDYLIQAKDTVGGDFLLTRISADGRWFYLMLGDLTGHGLQSALAVMLVTEVFDAQYAYNPDIEQLAHSINDKMCHKLPTGLFCAALMLKLDLASGRLHIWQGGMPDAYFLDNQGRVLQKLSSNNLPLGVLADQDYAGSATHYDLGEISSLFVYSDGLIEQVCDDVSMFGEDRLETALRGTPAGKRRVDEVIEKLQTYQQQHPQTDDISMLELHFARLVKALERP